MRFLFEYLSGSARLFFLAYYFRSNIFLQALKLPARNYWGWLSFEKTFKTEKRRLLILKNIINGLDFYFYCLIGN